MWGRVGIVRTGESLAKAVAQLTRWSKLVAKPLGTRVELEVKNLVQVAYCLGEAALWRENSIGAHYRADYPHAPKANAKLHSHVVVLNDGSSAGKGGIRAPAPVVALLRPRAGGGSRRRMDG